MQTLIKGGTIVTAADTYQSDILIQDEKITLIGHDLNITDAQVIEATGKLVMPGGIDVHTHLSLPFFDTMSADDFYTGHKAAAFGGTTCHIDFATQRQGESVEEALTRWHKKALGKAVIDYGGHMSITDPSEAILAELPNLLAEGVTTLKLFLSYKGVYMISDEWFFKLALRAAELGMLIMVHAENGDVVDTLIKKHVAEGNLTTPFHARSHPAWAEAEATMRAVTLCGLAQAPLYVVHMTCEEAVDMLRYGRSRGLPVMGETCPQYLFYTADVLERPDGAKWVFSPPLRTEKDKTALWQALANGDLQVVGTDHCPFLYDGTRPIFYEGEAYQMPGKELGANDFSQIPNGTHGIEDRLLLLWTYGVGQGRFSVNQFVAMTATNPAKIFGLYPQKGTIAVGSDADIVIWNPTAHKIIQWQTHHMRTDHNIYEGMELLGLPEKVLVRGQLLVDGETWHGHPGNGRFLRRQAHAPIL